MKTICRLTAAFLGVFAFMANAATTPSITFEGNTITVAGMTPGADVVLFTASLGTIEGQIEERTGARVFTDDDRSGGFAYTTPHGLVRRSVWVAVDLETGKYVFSSPGDAAIVRQLRTERIKRDSEGVLGIFDNDDQLTAEMLIVRPKAGAWRLRALEGGDGDADKTRNGKLNLASKDATPVSGNEKSPKRLKNGDVVAVIDPVRLELVIVELGKEK